MGMARKSLDLIEAMYTMAEAAQTITGRGIGYKLFTAGLIPSMSVNDMQKVYRLLRIAREQGDIPWEWIVDETREFTIYDVSQDDDGRELVVLYVGDYDPSGMFMSEEDLPTRLSKYDGDHVTLERIALTREQVRGLPSFPASDKRKDPRHKWYVANYGKRCWELDAMDPNDLRDCVEEAIKELIEPVAWERCDVVNKAEQDSLRGVLQKWGKAKDE
jgi:hypothetical protein